MTRKSFQALVKNHGYSIPLFGKLKEALDAGKPVE